jgi:metal-sulfur cluster biosynthetic enzyme
MTVTAEQIRTSLRPVKDPEINISIVDLGLIRGIEVDGTNVTVRLTLTSPMCPLGPEIVEAAKFAVCRIDGVEKAHVDLVWSPPWDPRVDATEDVKAQLGIWD